ncbi:MAG: ATP-binding protein [Desulfotomaculales bacterium]
MNNTGRSLTPEAAKTLLSFLYTTEARRSVLLLGPPGIGKSVLVREVAEETARAAGKKFFAYEQSDGEDVAGIYARPDRHFVFVDLRLTETEPVDLLGRPVTVSIAGRKQVVYQPPQWVALLAVAPGILFLDELTNVYRPDVLAAAYKLIQDRAAGFTGFSPGVQVVAAANRPEDSTLANPLPAPLVNRVYCMEVAPPSLAEWAAWMAAHHPGYDPRVLAYLYRFPDDFCRVPAEGETLEGYPTPRSFTSLAGDLPAAVNAGLDRGALRALCLAALGGEVGEKFFAFWEHPVPSYEELLAEPALFGRLGVDEQYMATVIVGQGLAARVEEAARHVPGGPEAVSPGAVLQDAIVPCVPLLDVMGDASREYLTLLWYIIAHRLHVPWREAVYLSMCEQSEIVRKAYASVGSLLRWPA